MSAKETRIRSVILAVLLANYAPRDASPILPPYLAAFMERLQSAARGARKRAKAACSNPLAEVDLARADAWRVRTEARLNATLEHLFTNKYGIPAPTVTLGINDARAPSAFLHIPNMRGDGWNADAGFAVY